MLIYEKLESDSELFTTLRAKVFGGWLVVVDADYGTGVTYLPDPQWQWDGSSPTQERAIVVPGAQNAEPPPDEAAPAPAPVAAQPALPTREDEPFTPAQQG